MNVGELRTVLEHLPDDLPVTISAPPQAAHHLTEVCRRNAIRNQPAGVRLGTRLGQPAPWLDPDPGFTLSGVFRRPDLLLRRLDPDVPLGSAWRP